MDIEFNVRFDLRTAVMFHLRGRISERLQKQTRRAMVRRVCINHLSNGSNLARQFYFAANVSDLSMHVRRVALFDNFCKIDYDPLNSVAWPGPRRFPREAA